MIYNQDIAVNVHDLQEQYGHLLPSPENDELVDSLKEFSDLVVLYKGAMMGISSQLELLDVEFRVQHRYNPIHHIESRLKGPLNIYEKLERYGFVPSINSARNNIYDIAGIRIICNFLNDIYLVESLLLKKPDIRLLTRKDYILHPKENGYRSLHLIVTTPVFLSDRTEEIPVEIQLRTMAMDYWASIEHMLRYKNYNSDMGEYSALLRDCANTLADTDETMQQIKNTIP